jgi:hypothetical protein
VILVFGGVGSLLAVVVVLGIFGAIDGWNKAGEEQHAEKAYWARQHQIADAMSKAAEDETRAVGTGVFVEGSTVTPRDPVEGVRVLGRR